VDHLKKIDALHYMDEIGPIQDPPASLYTLTAIGPVTEPKPFLPGYATHSLGRNGR